MIIYEHYWRKYDTDKYDPERFKPIENETRFTKPHGGFWACRKDDPDGWFSWDPEWVGENFEKENPFYFTLSEDARILTLSSTKDLRGLPKTIDFAPRCYIDSCYLDFEKLSEMYDAIEVTNINELYYLLYGWDCNSILIMNPRVIQPV